MLFLFLKEMVCTAGSKDKGFCEASSEFYKQWQVSRGDISALRLIFLSSEWLVWSGGPLCPSTFDLRHVLMTLDCIEVASSKSNIREMLSPLVLCAITTAFHPLERRLALGSFTYTFVFSLDKVCGNGYPISINVYLYVQSQTSLRWEAVRVKCAF